jgi:hypothetical protein
LSLLLIGVPWYQHFLYPSSIIPTYLSQQSLATTPTATHTTIYYLFCDNNKERKRANIDTFAIVGKGREREGATMGDTYKSNLRIGPDD